MFIGAGDEAHIAAHQSLKPRDCIGCYRFIRMAYMWLAIGIRDGSGDIIRFGHQILYMRLRFTNSLMRLQAGQQAPHLENDALFIER